MLVLDTCASLWLVSAQKKLSMKAKKAIEQHAGSLYGSAISAFEIAIKSRSGKLLLPIPIAEWFEEALRFHGIYEIPITSAIAISSVQLPPLHNDPCDRLIIATAMQNSMAIITCDRLISQYHQAEVIW